MTVLLSAIVILRIRISGLLVFVLHVIAPIDAAHADSTRSVLGIIGNDLQKAGEKTLLFITSPFRASGQDYVYFAAGSAAQVGLIALDDKTTPWIDRNFDFLRVDTDPTIWKHWGERDYAIGATLVTYGIGLAIDDAKTRRVARLLGESLLFSGIVNGLTKVVGGRSRPEQGDKWKWNIWETDDANQSFASGHTSIAFAVSSVLAEEIDNTAIDIGVYTLASLTGISRILDGRHWFGDVIGGAAIGTLCGIFATRNEDDVSDPGGDQGLRLYPNGAGVTLRYRY